QYLRFWRRYLEYQPPTAVVIIGLLAVGGLAWLWRRQRDIAAMALTLFLLLPLPFFLLSTSHFFASRYFSMILPVLLLLVAVGAVQIGYSLGRGISRRSRIVA